MFDRLSDASKGAVFLVSGISIFGFSDNLTLLVSDTVSVGQFHFSRSLIAMFMVIIAARLFGMPVLAKLWKPIAARTVFMVTSMLLYFGAMPMMPIAEAGLVSLPLRSLCCCFPQSCLANALVSPHIGRFGGQCGGLVRPATRCRGRDRLSNYAHFGGGLLRNRVDYHLSLFAG